MTLVYTPNALDPNQTTQAIDRTIAQDFFWMTQSDNFYEEYQDQYKIRYRTGGGAWTETGYLATVYRYGADQPHYKHTFAANTFTAGLTYEWQVLAHTTYGEDTPWSESAFFLAAAAGVNPTITAPAAGATITSGTTSLTWTLTTQAYYRVQVLISGTTVEYDSGILALPATRAHTVPLPNPGARTIRLMTRATSSAPWGQTDRAVTAAGTPPMQPTITATPDDQAGLGINTMLVLGITHPTPSGGAPAVATTEWWAARASMGIWVRIYPDASLFYDAPISATMWLKAVDVSADGRRRESGTLTVTPTINIKGVVVHEAGNWDTGVWLPLNDRGSDEDWDVVSALNQYVGRPSPTLEFDDTVETRTAESSRVSLENADEHKLEMVKVLISNRRPVCYRDHKGKKVIGRLTLGTISDRGWGWEFSLSIIATDYALDGLR